MFTFKGAQRSLVPDVPPIETTAAPGADEGPIGAAEAG